ncbi:MAG: hypothetical protein HY738_07920 [Bacteroidia bacterium]|nr:hypothetical protein [Bacteroidia bacterium]
MKITVPSEILDILRKKIIETLKQSGEIGSAKDGMDIALVALNMTCLHWKGKDEQVDDVCIVGVKIT